MARSAAAAKLDPEQARLLRGLASQVEKTGPPLPAKLAEELAEELEDRLDVAAFKEALAEGPPIPWETVKAKLRRQRDEPRRRETSFPGSGV